MLLSAVLQGPVTSAAAAAWYNHRAADLKSLHSSVQSQPAYVARKASGPLQTATPASTGFTPTQLENYYGFTGLGFGSTAANGKGQTIALVEAYDDPNISADLQHFDAAYGLAAPASFTVVSQTGSTASLPAADVADPVNGSWATEESLDVEWAHALAPGAGILVVECNSQNDADLYTGVAYAATAPGVSVVSMSFGQSETNYTAAELAAIDPTFVTPPGHQGVTFLASSGDSGAYADGGPLAVSFPASASGVVAVGGTTLTTNSSGNPNGETAWSGSGGGVSSLEKQTPAQKSAVGTYTGRAVPDVSFDADPNTGVNICDSLDFGSSTPFSVFGGTSFSSPAWGAILAITNQGRVQYNRPTLDGSQQTIPALYSAYNNGSYSSVFRDVTSGNNDFYNAGKGYDLVTGLGSPKVKTLIPQLVSNTIHSTPPVIGSFTINPAAENVGTSITLTAANITDTVGDLAGVNFYRLNGSVNQLLGAATLNAAGQWSLTVSTTGLAVGTYTYSAVATNNFKQSSTRVSATNKVVVGQATPVIGSFVVQPGAVPLGTNISLIATKVTDSTSSIASVAFYQDATPQPIFLGQGVNQGGGKWTLITSTANMIPGQYRYIAMATAASGLVSTPFKAVNTIKLGPPITVVVNTIKDQSDPRGSKTVSLRDAITEADLGIGQTTIEFDPSVFATQQTIVLTGSTLSLTDAVASTTIIGPAVGVVISGDANIQVMSIGRGAAVAISNLSLTNGSSDGSGAGLGNDGIATLTHVTVSDSINTGLVGNGGGIENDGTLNLVDCTITGNTTSNGNGGGIYNTAQLTVNQSTITQNTAFNGGGIGSSGTAKVSNSTISANTAFLNGGGIDSTGNLNVVDSTISGNTANTGAGLYNNGGYQSPTPAVATLTNSTVGQNAATYNDGAITNSATGELILNDCTIAANTAGSSYGGVDTAGSATLVNSIVAGNSAASVSSDVNGSFTSKGHNLIGAADGSSGWIGSDDVGSSAKPINANLSPLGNFGGPTFTFVPLAGSYALGHGSTSLIPGGVTTDQRGFARVVGGKVDIGSVQSQGNASIKLTAPPGQTLVGGTPVTVNLGSISGSNLIGSYISVVTNWGDGTPSTTQQYKYTGALQPATHTFTQLGSVKVSVVIANANGQLSNGISFTANIITRPVETIIVNTTADQTDAIGSSTISLRDAVNLANTYFGPVDITFSPKVFAAQKTITLKDGDLEFTNAHGKISITGPAAGVNISGGGATNILLVDDNAAVAITDLTITNASSNQLGAIDNLGMLDILDCTISGNTAMANGAGINNSGQLSMINSTLANNTSTYSQFSLGPSGDGGGLYNSGQADLRDVTITGNSSINGGGIDNIGILSLANTIVAGNTLKGGTTGPDVTGLVTSLGHNLIGKTDASSGWISTDFTGTTAKPLNPRLGPLTSNGGPTKTIAPLLGSAAINNGSPGLLPPGITTDQRGKPRTLNGKLDIGAVEV